MHIAMLAAGYPPDVKGGGEYSSQLLAEALTESGHDVSVLCAAQQASSFRINGVAVQRVLSPNLYWNFDRSRSPISKLAWHALENFNPWSEKAVRSFIRKQQPDVFVTSTLENFGAAAWTGAAKERVPIVHILRSYYTLCWQGTAFRSGRNCSGVCRDCRIATVGRRRASSLVSGVVGLCRATLDRHLQQGLFGRSKHFVLSDPVSSEVRPHTSSNLRAPTVFGYLGFLTRNKGVETIARALRLMEGGSGIPVMIAGTGEDQYVRSLQCEFEGMEARFLGWQDSREFLSRVDWLIVPSIWEEPFGRIVVEAFAAGVPVIGSASGGIGEMVTDEVSGFKFAPGNEQDLARAIERARDIDPTAYKRMSTNAMRAAQGYAGRPVAERYLSMLVEVMAEHRLTVQMPDKLQ